MMTPNDGSVMLQACLQMMQAGASIEEAAAQYPDHAAELRELAALTLRMQDAHLPLPADSAVQARGRAALQSALAEQRAALNDDEPALALVWPLRRLWGGVRRFSLLPQALPAALALLLLGGAALAAAAVTGDSGVLPGLGSGSRQARIELRGTIRGVDNVNAAITVVTASSEEHVLITPDTEFEGDLKQPFTLADFQPGDEVKISAVRRDGELFAREVELEARPQPASSPTVPRAPTAQPTADDDRFDEDNRGPGGADDPDDEDHQGPGRGDDGDDDDNGGPGGGDDGNRGRGTGGGDDGQAESGSADD